MIGFRLPGVLGTISVALLVSACSDGTGPTPRAASLEVIGGGQRATVATVVPVPPQVRVLTADGEPVGGVEVTFTVSQGEGTIAAGVQRTGHDGTAAVGEWKLGTRVGLNQVTARVGALTAQITATATAGPAETLAVVTQPPTLTLVDFVFAPQPVVELRDLYGNTAEEAGGVVTASLSSGPGILEGSTVAPVVAGRATFTNLSVTYEGEYQLSFAASDLEPVISSSFAVAATVSGNCQGRGAVELTLDLGETLRSAVSDSLVTCLQFDPVAAAGHQYLLLLENLPAAGGFENALFPGPGGSTAFTATVTALPATFGGAPAPVALNMALPASDPEANGWDFGDGAIYEEQVVLPPGGVDEPRLHRNGSLVAMSSVLADPQVGDIVTLRLEGIPRLSIPSGDQQVVIRYITPDLIFAEDTRLQSTLMRPNGGFNTPMTVADMDAIASEYAAFARPQADALFDGRHNASTQEGARSGGRIIAVHTLMPSEGTWGYTYSVSDYFAFDYWVASNGFTKGNNQVAQRIADDLFMHEIAHMRHCGIMEAGGRTCFDRGNRWLVEGFARFTERLPIASRLLQQPIPARNANLVLPLNPIFNGGYYLDDVPTYLSAGASMLEGYAASSYVFDYFADLVAARGLDPFAALRDFLLNGGTEAALSSAVDRWLPGMSFGDLFTRARIALYADDYGTPALPPSLQYQQFQLRASRPPGSQGDSDPRNAWPVIRPGVLSHQGVTVQPGSAYGYLIDGVNSVGGARIDINATSGPHAILSVTRIR
jgi:hypothetical protein